MACSNAPCAVPGNSTIQIHNCTLMVCRKMTKIRYVCVCFLTTHRLASAITRKSTNNWYGSASTEVAMESENVSLFSTWWRHQMETFSALLAICEGNSPVPVNSPHKGQWRGALMFSLISPCWNGWVNNREAADLRRNHAHYDVILMTVYQRVQNSFSAVIHVRQGRNPDITQWWPNHCIQ